MGRTSDARDRLLKAARRLVWERSYGAVGVDAICQAAGVQKGSFYHFFPSKEALIAAAIEDQAEEERPALDAVFSPLEPPLERLWRFFQLIEEMQLAARGRCGRTLGCPLATLGSEMAALAPEVAERVRAVMDRNLRYVESALRDAQAQGLVRADADARALAGALFTHLEGVLVQARIADDPAVAARLRAGAELLLRPVPASGAAPARAKPKSRRAGR